MSLRSAPPAALLVFVLAAATQAQPVMQSPVTAQTCAAPLSPPPISMRPGEVIPRPTVPPCVDEARHINRCRNKEIEQYNAAIHLRNEQIMRWNEQSGRYVKALNDWQSAAAAYAHCEIELMNAQMGD